MSIATGPGVRVLILAGYYLPGYQGGGPIRSLANLVERLGDEVAFLVVTRDRDLGAREPYPDIVPQAWHAVGRAEVMYRRGGRFGRAALRAVLRERRPDLLYLNSHFDPHFTVLPLLWRRLGLLGRRLPVVLAPRGELFAGALALKAGKKRLFFRLAGLLGLYRDVHWQAASAEEASAIRAHHGTTAKIAIVPNLPAVIAAPAVPVTAKRSGALRLVQVARIARNKNLLGAIRALAEVPGEVVLTVYGTVEDAAYWDECRQAIAALPPTAQVEFHGPVAPEEVPRCLAGHDFFLLLTHGENFGHAIVEALLSGLPVIVSDRTPWRQLEQAEAGFDVACEDAPGLRRALGAALVMDADTHRRWRGAARAYIEERLDVQGTVAASRRLFAEAVAT